MDSSKTNPDAAYDSLEWVEETAGSAGPPPAGPAPAVHDRNLRATQEQPENVEAWIDRAQTAETIEEKIFCLSQVNRLAPAHPRGKARMHETLWRELRRDSFLSYLEETGQIYFVRNQHFTSLAIAKDRSETEPYPPKRETELHAARRKLGWAVAGLALSGLGTLVFIPLALRSSVRFLRAGPGERKDRVQAWIVIGLSLLLAPVALALAWVFAIHI